MDDRKKFILITGASSGIGRSISVGLSQNFNVILNGRNFDRLEETKKNCSKSTDNLIFPYDLSNVAYLEDVLVSFIKSNNIEICQFIHCAGFMKMVPLKMINLEHIDITFKVNVISAAIIIKVLINRNMNNSALDNVVFISSNISNFGAKAFSIYGSSKSGLDGLMRNLAVELAPKVRLNSILPGAINTGMTESIFNNQDVIQNLEKTYPLGLGNSNDICEMVSFLISKKSRWITGQQIIVDGGRTINISG